MNNVVQAMVATLHKINNSNACDSLLAKKHFT